VREHVLAAVQEDVKEPAGCGCGVGVGVGLEPNVKEELPRGQHTGRRWGGRGGRAQLQLRCCKGRRRSGSLLEFVAKSVGGS
jgi:hypothetical protein